MYLLSIPHGIEQSFIFSQNVFAFHSTQHRTEFHISRECNRFPIHTAQGRVSYSLRMSSFSIPRSIGQSFIFPQNVIAFHSTQHRAEFHIHIECLRFSFHKALGRVSYSYRMCTLSIPHSTSQSFIFPQNVFTFHSTRHRTEFHILTECLRFPFHTA